MKQYFYKTLLICLLACIGQTAWAYDFTAKSDDEFYTDLYFTINADGTTVTLTKGETSYSAKSITIPGTVEHDGKTYTVTTIGSQVFNYTNGVVEIVMPNTITEVQSYAFANSAIANVTFSKNLKNIRDNAFQNTNLEKVELFEGLESIGKRAFEGNGYKKGINTLILPNSLTEIGEYAFCSQMNLTEVDLPDNLDILEDNVFSGCTSLATVKLPEGLKNIGSHAFAYCAMESITFPTSLKTIKDGAFLYAGLKEVDLPDNITSIGDYCFEHCEYLQSIRFSAGLTELPRAVCDGDAMLTNITIPESITKIGRSAFGHCEILSNVILPESITEIDSYAFSYTGIAVLKFPPKVCSLSYGLFLGCKNIQEITIPETITRLEGGVFEYCENLKSVTLPSSLTYIGEYAFMGCSLLTEIDIPASVLEIAENCFRGCEKLAKVEINKGLEKISNNAFYGCIELKELSLPSTLKSIGQFALSEASNINKVHMSRVIPPTVTTELLGGTTVFCTDNECTLYVPVGCKITYESDSNWNAKYIEEEEVDGELEYQMVATTNSSKAGKLFVSTEDEQLSSTAVVRRNTKLTVEIVANDGYHFVSLVYNDKDVTSEVVDGTYTIDAVNGNITLNATFAENPYTIYLKSSEQGTIGIPVEKGNSITCDIVAADGWKINSVYFGYSDVTDQLTEDGAIMVTPSYDGETLSVSFEQSLGIEGVTDTESNVKAHVTQNGTLYVENVIDGRKITVYYSDGKVADTLKANAGSATTQLSAKGIYIVKVQGKSIKVMY